MKVSDLSLQEDSPLNRLRRWQHGETPGPWYITWYPTKRCNLRCVMCWRNEFEFDPRDEVPDDRVLLFVDECAELGVREWCITGGGEPLLREALVTEACRRIRHHGMNGNLTQNATLLKPDFMRALIEVGWADVTCSLDAPTAEVHDAIRGKGTFDRSTSAMAEFARMRREMKADSPTLSFTTTVMRQNCHLLPDMVELAHRMGCDSARGLLIMGHWCTDYLLTPEQTAALPEIVERVNKRGQELGIATDFASIVDTHVSDRRRQAILDRVFGKPQGISGAPCFDPWHSLAVLGDGCIGPCCASWFADAPRITEGSLRELWTGPFLTRVRDSMARGQMFEFCKVCPPLLAKRGELTRRVMRFCDIEEAWRDLTLFQKTFLAAWETRAQLAHQGIGGAVRTLFKKRGKSARSGC